MKRTLLSVIAATALTGNVSAAIDQPSDSINTRELNEVTVQADMQQTSATGSTYIPGHREKNAAQNGIHLLYLMNIPQIKINPADGAVTTPTGANVSIFVNYLPATAEELSSLQANDVKKVEYLDFPSDPRFHGAQHVINIVMQTYKYGGYTKVSADENILTGLSSKISLYSKFAFKRMTYDLFVGSVNRNPQGKSGDATTGIYRFDDAVAKRTKSIDRSEYTANSLPVSFRALYHTPTIEISNTVGYSFKETPENNSYGNLSISGMGNSEYRYNDMRSDHSNNISWYGNYYFMLPRQFCLNLSPAMTYSHNNDKSVYSTDIPTCIINHPKENAYAGKMQVNLRKTLSRNQSFQINLLWAANGNKITYHGSSPSVQKFYNPMAGGYAGYTLATGKFNFAGSLGLFYEQVRINGSRMDRTSPAVYASLGYSPDKRNSLNFELSYGMETPGISAKSPNKLQQNELMFYSGNPDLKNSGDYSASLSYTWMPQGGFAAMLYGKYHYVSQRITTAYFPDNMTNTMLRTYINSGHMHDGQIGASLSWRPAGTSLKLSANPALHIVRTTGYYDISHTPFSFNASAAYYVRNFYFQADFVLHERSLIDNTGAWYRDRNYWSMGAGWSKNNLNARLTLINIGRNDWRCASLDTTSPNYSEHITRFGTTAHQRINLAVTYTFGYGKKLTPENEIEAPSGASSAILR